MASEEANKKSKGILKIALGLSLLAFVGGAGAGAVAWHQFSPMLGFSEVLSDATSGDTGHDGTPELEYAGNEIHVGRIVVSLSPGQSANDSERVKLLVDSVLVIEGELEKDEDTEHRASTEEEGFVGRAAVRDAFVEYLMQLSEDEVRGSYGLAKVRAELLRRAKLVMADTPPSEVLIQEFMIQ